MRHTSRGFTLIELLVTIGIFVFMTYLILARYGSFNSGTLLTNMAYDVALTIRTAQTYGVSVLASKGVASNPFNAAYGVDFNKSGDNRSFRLFADLSGNHFYDSGEDVSKYNLKQGARIKDLCVRPTGGNCTSVDRLAITFKRPDPSALIYGSGSADAMPFAQITIESADGSSFRLIKVNEYGQISVTE